MRKTVILICLLVLITTALAYPEVEWIKHNDVYGYFITADEARTVIKMDIELTYKDKEIALLEKSLKSQDFYRIATYVAAGIILAETSLLIIGIFK